MLQRLLQKAMIEADVSAPPASKSESETPTPKTPGASSDEEPTSEGTWVCLFLGDLFDGMTRILAINILIAPMHHLPCSN